MASESGDAKKRKPTKQKPPEKFPLTLHPKGYWCKKVRGRLYYFGKDQDAALKEWLRVKPDLLAGRPLEEDQPHEQMTLGDLCNRFLHEKKGQIPKEFTAISWHDYRRACDRMLRILGRNTIVDTLREADFAKLYDGLAKGVSSKTLSGRIDRCRILFRYGEAEGLVSPLMHKLRKPLKKPKRKSIDFERGDTRALFKASEIRLLLEHATPELKAAILMGINCGFGPEDCARLKLGNLDLVDGWLDQRRSKTGKARRAALWPETIAALQAVIAKRGKLTDKDLVFVTKRGNPLSGIPVKSVRKPEARQVRIPRSNPISTDFYALRESLGITGKHKAFYSLRRTTKTEGENVAIDPVAIDHVMGHLDRSTPGGYRQYVSDARLRAISDALRSWLFPPESKPKAKATRKRKPKGE